MAVCYRFSENRGIKTSTFDLGLVLERVGILPRPSLPSFNTLHSRAQESKLEFSEMHGKFVETVFGLLEKFLAEIGVSQEEFSSVCQQQVMSGGKNAFVFQQVSLST